MSGLDVLEWIARESEAFTAVLDDGRIDDGLLENTVPGCPEWTLRDLAWHLGRVQRFWASVVRAGADVAPTFPEGNGPTDAAELTRWMRASTRELLETLRTTAPETPAWVWWRDDRTVGAIARHQVQEAAVHRWDAQSAVGVPAALEQTVADDGVDEFVGIARQLREPAAITLVATDSGRSFPVSEEPPVVTVSAPASDLVLLLYGRVPVDAVRIDGNRTTLDSFLLPIG